MDTSSLASSPTIIVPDDHPFGISTSVPPQAVAQGTVQHHSTGPGVGEEGQLPRSSPTLGMLPGRRWLRGLAWSGLGLLVSFVCGALWLMRQPPLMPPSPPIHNERAAAALPGATVPPALPTATRPPPQSQGQAAHASIVDTVPGSVSPDVSPQRAERSLARDAAPRRSGAVAPPRAARAGQRQHARKHHAATRSRKMRDKPVGSVSHRGEPFVARPSPRWTAPSPAPEVERPWNWHIIPPTGDG
jgi:hypothetical protein